MPTGKENVPIYFDGKVVGEVKEVGLVPVARVTKEETRTTLKKTYFC